jgi:hypothetical protein
VQHDGIKPVSLASKSHPHALALTGFHVEIGVRDAKSRTTTACPVSNPDLDAAEVSETRETSPGFAEFERYRGKTLTIGVVLGGIKRVSLIDFMLGT